MYILISYQLNYVFFKFSQINTDRNTHLAGISNKNANKVEELIKYIVYEQKLLITIENIKLDQINEAHKVKDIAQSIKNQIKHYFELALAETERTAPNKRNVLREKYLLFLKTHCLYSEISDILSQVYFFEEYF